MKELKYQLDIAVEPAVDVPAPTIAGAIDTLSAQHAGFSASFDITAKQVIIRGRDEVHLEENVSLFRESLGVDLAIGAPQVIYRETVSRRGVSWGRSETSEHGHAVHFAVRLAVEPLDCGAGYVFETAAGCPALPAPLAAPAADTLAKAINRGVLAGFGMTDLKVSLLNWQRGAGRVEQEPVHAVLTRAFREAAEHAKPVLLEPVSLITVTSPEDCFGDVIADLVVRRGWLLDTAAQGPETVITAHVPLAEMLGYENVLRRISSGRARCRLEPSHWQRVPRRGGNDTPPSEPGAGALVA